MTKEEYYLLKFVAAVRVLVGRKKLQKIIFLMKHGGLPIEDRFFWHYYGPYSADLALQIDTLVNKKWFDERHSSGGYTYKITKEGREVLEKIEGDKANRTVMGSVTPLIKKFCNLAEFRVADLEKAASVIYWYDICSRFKDAIYMAQLQKGRVSKTAIDIAKRAINLG